MAEMTFSGKDLSPADVSGAERAALAELHVSLLDAALNLRAQLAWLAENGVEYIPKSMPISTSSSQKLFRSSESTVRWIPSAPSLASSAESAAGKILSARRPSERPSAPPSAPRQAQQTARIAAEAPASMRPPFQPLAGSTEAGRVLTPMTTSAEELLEKARSCSLCPMKDSRTGTLVGNGIWRSDLMLVGDRPCAPAGGPPRLYEKEVFILLEKMIRAIGRDIDKTACVNAVQCVASGELAFQAPQACRPLLWTAVSLVQPKVIISLGKVATQALLDVATPITRMRGIWQTCGGVRIMPTYHPAYLLKHAEAKREAWEDLKQVRAFLDS